MKSRFLTVGKDATSMHIHFERARRHEKKSCLIQTGCIALVFWLWFPGSAGVLKSQSSPGAEHAARASQLLQAGDLNGAETEMRRAVKLAPQDPEYLVRLALILGRLRRPTEAAGIFESALALDPNNMAVRRNLAVAQWQMGRLAAAQENLELILKADPRDTQSLLLLCSVFIDARRYAAALVVAQTAVDAAPSSYRAFALKGMAEMRMQRYTDSTKSYARAAELNPNAAEANIGLAMSLWGAGSTAESFAAFERGLKRFPGDAYHCLEYGRLLLKSAKPDDSTTENKAILLLQNALKLNPSISEAHYLLGDLALRRGKLEEALAQLEQAAKLDPDSSKTHFALFRAYRRLGRQEEAAREEELFQKLKAKEEVGQATPLLIGGLD